MYQVAVVLGLVTSAFAGFLDGDLQLTEGVKLVGIPVSNSLEEEGRSFGDNSVLYRMAKFLQGHELHVKLPQLIEKDKITHMFSESLKAVDQTYNNSSVSGRGKGGGGGASVALLGMMFAKALGAAGIGGLGLLTMKALAVSALALLLSAVVGVKKLAHHDDHDDHQVIYAGHHGHHRRRRDLDMPLPYQGWVEYAKMS
ncbi:uncharacterized protein LOC128680487 [Plodia interpunctella]|uniref:uncharacterized protein LOC128680487 n=1 Tax=Plodia interpunctella TaxID=58824 RepID=UPI0023679B1D|nr:uncharacterized protein LOC128680487 [Plodia interpunctella]